MHGAAPGRLWKTSRVDHAYGSKKGIGLGVKRIFLSGEVILIYPLLGKKQALDGVPLVQRIADELYPHGARYLGWVAKGLLVGDLDPTHPPPALEKIWSQLCAFDLCWDFENDILQVVWEHCQEFPLMARPKDLLYDRLEALRPLAPLTRHADGMYRHVGFAGDEDASFGAVYDLVILHFEHGVGIDPIKIGRDAHKALTGVQKERTLVFARAMKRFAPDTEWGGNFLITDSQAVADLKVAKAEVPGTLKLLRQLRSIDNAKLKDAVGSSLAPAPSPASATTTKGAQGGGGA